MSNNETINESWRNKMLAEKAQRNKAVARVLGAVLVDGVWLIHDVWQAATRSNAADRQNQRDSLVVRASTLIENASNLMDRADKPV